MKRFVVLFWIFQALAANAGDTGGALIPAKAPDFTLHDQRDQPVTLRLMEGRPVVLIASDRQGSEQNGPWRKAISEKYGGRLHIMGVADTRGVPFFLKGAVKRDFKDDPARILLDWDGVVFTSYGLAAKASNVILIDRKGHVRYLHSGIAERGAVERLFREIDKSLDDKE